MKILSHWPALLAIAAIGILAGCSQTAKSPEVSGDIRKALDQAGLKKVSIVQDRDKGVVTLGGQVGWNRDKEQAEAIATSNAGGQVVSDQIAVVPFPTGMSVSSTVRSTPRKSPAVKRSLILPHPVLSSRGMVAWTIAQSSSAICQMF